MCTKCVQFYMARALTLHSIAVQLICVQISSRSPTTIQANVHKLHCGAARYELVRVNIFNFILSSHPRVCDTFVPPTTGTGTTQPHARGLNFEHLIFINHFKEMPHQLYDDDDDDTRSHIFCAIRKAIRLDLSLQSFVRMCCVAV